MVIFEARNQLITALLLTSYLTLQSRALPYFTCETRGLFIHLFKHLLSSYHLSETVEALDRPSWLRHKTRWVREGSHKGPVTVWEKSAVFRSEGCSTRSGAQPRRGVARECFSEAGAEAGRVGAGGPRHYLFLVKGFLRLGCCPMFPPISPDFVLVFEVT